MTFTNEDVKRLKGMGTVEQECWIRGDSISPIEALISRLEIAEIYIVNHHRFCQPPPCDDYLRWLQAIGEQ